MFEQKTKCKFKKVFTLYTVLWSYNMLKYIYINKISLEMCSLAVLNYKYAKFGYENTETKVMAVHCSLDKCCELWYCFG